MHRRTSALATLIAVGLSLTALASSALAVWGQGNQAAKDDGKTTMTCGDLSGEVGCCWGGFTPTGAGTASMTTDGDVGVKWTAGSEPTTGSQSPVPQDKVNYVTHAYVGNSSPLAVTCDLATTHAYGGSASRHQNPPPEWHWTWAGNVNQQDPLVSYWNGSSWSTPATFPVADTASDTNGQLSGSGSGGSVTSTGTTGAFSASRSQSGVTGVRMTATFDSHATAASALNCDISENFIKMHFAFVTSVN